MVAVPSIGRASLVEAPQVAPEALATEGLYERHAAKILSYCQHQLGSREEAEDAVQTTFMNAFRALAKGIVPESETAWLFKIAENVCLSRRRSSWRRNRIESPSDFEVIEEIVPGPSRQRDELIGIEDALASMPEQQRRAILLREWQGLSYREIADELEVTQAAVETLIFRARRSLAQGLEQPQLLKTRKKPRTGLRRALHAADLGTVIASVKTLLTGAFAAKATATAVTVAVAAGAAATVAPKVVHSKQKPSSSGVADKRAAAGAAVAAPAAVAVERATAIAYVPAGSAAERKSPAAVRRGSTGSVAAATRAPRGHRDERSAASGLVGRVGAIAAGSVPQDTADTPTAPAPVVPVTPVAETPVAPTQVETRAGGNTGGATSTEVPRQPETRQPETRQPEIRQPEPKVEARKPEVKDSVPAVQQPKHESMSEKGRSAPKSVAEAPKDSRTITPAEPRREPEKREKREEKRDERRERNRPAPPPAPPEVAVTASVAVPPTTPAATTTATTTTATTTTATTTTATTTSVTTTSATTTATTSATTTPAAPTPPPSEQRDKEKDRSRDHLKGRRG